MRLSRCRDQPSKTLLEFYASAPAEVGGVMGDLIERLCADDDPRFAWGLTSHLRLYLLAEDSYKSPWYVSFLANSVEVSVDYLVPAHQAPWPDARVVGVTPDLQVAVQMIRAGMWRSGGWPLT